MGAAFPAKRKIKVVFVSPYITRYRRKARQEEERDKYQVRERKYRNLEKSRGEPAENQHFARSKEAL